MRYIRNRFRIKKKIGEGGMGVVYMVEDILKDNSVFAIKTIKRDLYTFNKNISLEGFKNEYEIMTKLRHPNLVQVYGFAIDESNCYILMEYIDGKLLKDMDISFEKCIDIITEVLRALEFIHSRNIIYFDIKPENIMITDTGIKLLDFGLSDSISNKKDKIKGTIFYMAPESLTGGIDFRLDIYSLGILFYELIIDQKFYLGDYISINSIINILKDKKEHDLHLERKLERIKNHFLRDIIRKMMCFNKDKRYGSCSEIIDQINTALGRNYPYETELTKESYLLGGDFVNRKDEFDLMIRNIYKPARINLFVISGAIGTGKTRLLYEFKKECQLNNIDYFETACIQGYSNPYHSISEIINQAIPLASSDILDKYGIYLKYIIPDNKYVSKYDTLKVDDPKGLKRLLIINLSGFLMDLQKNSNNTMIISIDDIEWIDEGSLKIMDYMLEKLDLPHNKNIKLLFYAGINENKIEKDEIKSLISNREKAEKIILKPLKKSDVKIYIENIFGQRFIDRSVLEAVETINERIGGNPLFLGELIRSMIINNIIYRDKQSWKLRSDIKEIYVPAKLSDIVIGRINRLFKDKSKKEVLQLLSILRIDLSFEEIKEIMNQISGDKKELARLLILLERNEILQSFYISNRLYYRFVSRLVKETIKDTIVNIKSLNRSLALALENISHNSDNIEEIAYHFYEAGFIDTAVEYYHKCADKASGLYFHEKAIKYYDIILINTHEREIKLLIEINLKKIDSLDMLGKWDEAIEIIQKCIELSKKHHLQMKTGLLYMSYAVILMKKGKYIDSQANFENALKIFREQKAEKYICGIYLSLSDIFLNYGEIEKALKYINDALEIFKTLNDEDGVYKALFHLAMLNYSQGRFNEALEHLFRNAEYDKKCGRKIDLLKCYNNIGLVYFQQGNLHNALKYYDMCLNICLELNCIENKSIVIGNMGIIYEDLGQFQKALQCYFEKLNISMELDYKKGMGIACLNIGNIYRANCKLSNSLKYYNKALNISESFNSKLGMAHAYGNIGGVYKEQFNYNEALIFYKKQFDIAEEIGNLELKTNYFQNMAYINIRTGFFSKADNFINEIMKISKEINNKQIKGTCMLLMGDLHKIQKDFNSAVIFYRKAKNIFLEFKNQYTLCQAYIKICEVLIEMNDIENALKEYDQATIISEKLSLKSLLYYMDILRYRLSININDHDEYFQEMEENYTLEHHIAEINYYRYLENKDIYSKTKSYNIYNNLYKKSNDMIIKERLDMIQGKKE